MQHSTRLTDHQGDLPDLLCFVSKDLFIQCFDCGGSLLLRMGFLQLQWVGVTLRCGTWTFHCGDVSGCKAQAPGAGASAVEARRLSSCGSWAPGPGSAVVVH